MPGGLEGQPGHRSRHSDWLYLTLRRRGKDAEAAALLKPITKDLAVIENTAYRDRLLLYKGEKTAAELRAAATALRSMRPPRSTGSPPGTW